MLDGSTVCETKMLWEGWTDEAKQVSTLQAGNCKVNPFFKIDYHMQSSVMTKYKVYSKDFVMWLYSAPENLFLAWYALATCQLSNF